MNRKNKILVGCLALLLVLSVGYALFSETITINGTATAKGSFDLTFTCEADEGFLQDFNIEASASCSINGQTITTTSTLPKPSENTNFMVTIRNNGTIPAVLKTVDSSNNFKNDNVTAGDEVYHDTTYKLTGFYVLGTMENPDVEYSGDKAVEDAGIVLEPNEEMVILIFHTWESSFTGEGVTMPEDGVTMNYNMTLGFEQITVQ